MIYHWQESGRRLLVLSCRPWPTTYHYLSPSTRWHWNRQLIVLYWRAGFCADTATSASMTEGSRKNEKEREKKEKRKEEREKRKEGGENMSLCHANMPHCHTKIWVATAPDRRTNVCPMPRSGRHIMPYAPPYFTPLARSRGAYLYGWGQEQAYVYAKKFRLRRATIPARRALPLPLRLALVAIACQ